MLAHPHLSFSKGAINAFPLRSWKNLVATLLGALQSWGLMPGLEAAVGSLNALLPAFLSMSLRHCWVARSVAPLLRKARLCRRMVLHGGGGRRLPGSLIYLFISHHSPVGRGPPKSDGVALLYQPLGTPDGTYRYLRSWPGASIVILLMASCESVSKVKSCPVSPLLVGRRRP